MKKYPNIYSRKKFSIFKFIGILIFEAVIFYIMYAYGLWNAISWIDKLFFAVGGLIIAIFLSKKKEFVRERVVYRK